MRAESHQWYRQQLQVSACSASASTINIMLCCFSIEIKVDLSRCCLSLLNSSVLVLSPSVTSIVHCLRSCPSILTKFIQSSKPARIRMGVLQSAKCCVWDCEKPYPPFLPPRRPMFWHSPSCFACCGKLKVHFSCLLSAHYCALVMMPRAGFSSRPARIVSQLDDFAAGRWRGCRNMTCFACSSRLQKKRKNTVTRLFFRLLFALHRLYENNWG